MKILVIFIDMIRPNRLSTFNDQVDKDTLLDKAFKDLGGTVYTNCFTPGPDTPRGLSSFFTGIEPYLNGCNTRLKWPQHFLKEGLSTIFDIFIRNDFSITCFSSPAERENGLFPENIEKQNIHNMDYDLGNYLSSVKLKKNHMLFIGIPDYHWAFDDFGYTTNGEKKAYHVVKSVYDKVFESFNRDDFDHIFVFSDHGFKFNLERKLEPQGYLVNEDRTNCLLIHRTKYQNELIKNNRMCSLCDLYPTFEDILDSGDQGGYSLLGNEERDFVVVEDHLDFMPTVNQNLQIWAVIKKDFIYIRTLESGFVLCRETGKRKKGMISEFDNILKENSSFRTYLDEYDKIFNYKKNILSKNMYMNGKQRKPANKINRFFSYFIDFIKFSLQRSE